MRFLALSVLLSLSFHGGPKYQGIPLPAGAPGTSRIVPGAWLIAGQRAIHATQGSYCFGGACVDVASVQMLPHVASTQFGGRSVTIVVRSRIRSASASLASWSRPGHPRRLTVHVGHAGHMAVLRIALPASVRNSLLSVSVSFPPRFHTTKRHVVGGNSSYLWRLNP